jgi:hypothetical protein
MPEKLLEGIIGLRDDNDRENGDTQPLEYRVRRVGQSGPGSKAFPLE